MALVPKAGAEPTDSHTWLEERSLDCVNLRMKTQEKRNERPQTFTRKTIRWAKPDHAKYQQNTHLTRVCGTSTWFIHCVTDDWFLIDDCLLLREKTRGPEERREQKKKKKWWPADRTRRRGPTRTCTPQKWLLSGKLPGPIRQYPPFGFGGPVQNSQRLRPGRVANLQPCQAPLACCLHWGCYRHNSNQHTLGNYPYGYQ